VGWEIAELEELARRAGALKEAEAEAKPAKLKQVLKEQGFFDDSGERLLIFTEFKDTLGYLVRKLTNSGFKVGFIHGGMQIGSRDIKGSRLYAEQQFREGAVQVLSRPRPPALGSRTSRKVRSVSALRPGETWEWDFSSRQWISFRLGTLTEIVKPQQSKTVNDTMIAVATNTKAAEFH